MLLGRKKKKISPTPVHTLGRDRFGVLGGGVRVMDPLEEDDDALHIASAALLEHPSKSVRGFYGANVPDVTRYAARRGSTRRE